MQRKFYHEDNGLMFTYHNHLDINYFHAVYHNRQAFFFIFQSSFIFTPLHMHRKTNDMSTNIIL